METLAFGTSQREEPASLYLLENKNHTMIKVSDYGATLVSVLVLDKNGVLQDVVLGYDNAGQYESHSCYFGATIGRNCNRIEKAQMMIDGKLCKIAAMPAPLVSLFQTPMSPFLYPPALTICTLAPPLSSYLISKYDWTAIQKGTPSIPLNIAAGYCPTAPSQSLPTLRQTPEHETLFEIIAKANDLVRAELLHDKYDEIVGILDQLQQYTKEHFADEEEYMESIGYPGLHAQ